MGSDFFIRIDGIEGESTDEQHSGRIEWAHIQQSRSGGYALGQVAGGWNREKNCRI